MEKEIIQYEHPDLPVRLHRLCMDSSGAYRGMHAHRAVEIVDVKRGVLSCYFGDGRAEVKAGQVIFINSNTGHRLFSDDAEIIYLQLDVNLLEDGTRRDGSAMLSDFLSHIRAKPYMTVEGDGQLSGILGSLYTKYGGRSPDARWHLKGCLCQLMGFMCEREFVVPMTVQPTQFAKIKDAVSYMEANFPSPITLGDICAAAKYSRYTVCHTFKAVTGSTIFDYLNFLRVHHAADMLKDPKTTILDVAARCGFSSGEYFNRVFKSFFGCPPSVYRRLLPK